MDIIHYFRFSDQLVECRENCPFCGTDVILIPTAGLKANPDTPVVPRTVLIGGKVRTLPPGTNCRLLL